ncbi:MAG: hypothetical protein ACRCZF_22295, partial [Gemmataceae bacterium]
TDVPAKATLIDRIHFQLRHLPTEIARPIRTDPAGLERTLRQLLTRPEADPALRDAAGKLLQRLPNAEQLQQTDAANAQQLHTMLVQLQGMCVPTPPTIEQLPPAFRERYVGPEGEFLVRGFATGNLWEIDELRQFTSMVSRTVPEATGKPFRTLEGLDQMRLGFVRAAGFALIVIVMVLACDFRSLRLVAWGLFPLAAGMLLTLATLALLGVPLNPANLIALPLIVGVGVDHGVHVLHDFQNDARPEFRLSAATGRGVLVAALTTILGFGTLMIARHRGMASLGLTLTLGVTACMTMALVVLPVLLRKPRRPSASIPRTVSRSAA